MPDDISNLPSGSELEDAESIRASGNDEIEIPLVDDGSPTPAQEFQRQSEKRLLDELFVAASQYRVGKKYAELLKFVSAFKRYSAYNAMLVHVQKPGAKYVLTASCWKRDHRQFVKPNAQPLMILQPGGPVMFVFDVSDVEPIDPSHDTLPQAIVDPFAVSGTACCDLKQALTRLTANCKKDGIRVQTVAHGASRAGSIQPAASREHVEYKTAKYSVQRRYEMLLNASHSEATQLVTAFHELAHLYCGHLGTPNRKWWPNRIGLPTNVEEFEAESVCYLVCRRLGLDPGSSSYLSGYLGTERNIPEISVDTVMKATRQVETLVGTSVSPRSQDRTKK